MIKIAHFQEIVYQYQQKNPHNGKSYFPFCYKTLSFFKDFLGHIFNEKDYKPQTSLIFT